MGKQKGLTQNADGKPVWICQTCGQRQKLDFDPKRDKVTWHYFKCPVCEVARHDKEKRTPV